MRRRAFSVAIAIGVAAAIAGSGSPALAAWRSPGSGNASARARLMPSGPQPTAAVANRSVTLSWTAVSFPNGAAVGGYQIARYDAATGAAQSVGSSCSGTISSLTCTEDAVPAGNWRYAVAPRTGNWTGAEGARSAVVTVAAPKLTITTPSTVITLPATLNANLTSFISGQSVTFRLDDASTGAPLTATVTASTIPASGSVSASITLPKGVADGTHTIYALGGSGDVASASVSVVVPRPTPVSLALINGSGGQAGRPAPGDRVEVTYSHRLDVASICSTWSNDANNQAINGDYAVIVRVADNAAPSGNDLVTVTTTNAACGGQLHFGQVDLGSPDFVAGGSTLFAGTGTGQSLASWDATAFKLTITLGAKATGVNPARVTTPTTAVYTPDASILSSSGRSITGTAASTAVQF